MAGRTGDGLSGPVGAFRALADPVRLRLLALIDRAGEVCVCHLHGALGLPQPTVSRHLAYLRRAGLVQGRRDGAWVHYRLARPASAFHGALLAASALAAPEVFAADRERLDRARDCRAAEVDDAELVVIRPSGLTESTDRIAH
ncbi:MAG: metalloregulator ArsR/SmtB family transcription factor [Thermoleophilia bacterium]|nr:metalloregulator ArsR/SmtB family transcription factor [Thermoleophilia bacterium]